MSNCTECTQTETICEETKPCGCPIQDLSTDCVKYDGPALSCSGITLPDTLTQIIYKLDKFICDKFNSSFIGELFNIGAGAQVYKQTNIAGRQEVRTLESSDDSIVITQNADTINFVLAEGAGEDKYVNSVSFNGTLLTLGFNIGADLTVNLSSVNTDNFLSVSPTFNSSTGEITFTMEDATEYVLDISELQQTQSNVLELDNTSPAFIKNQNPQGVITTSYTLQPSDNNKVLLLDTTGGNIVITVDVVGQSLPANYFVGFLQDGTNEVSFTGYDVKPVQYTDVIQGQGHNAAIEVFDKNGTLKSFLSGSLNEIV